MLKEKVDNMPRTKTTINFKHLIVITSKPASFVKELNKLLNKYEVESGDVSYVFKEE